MRGDVSLRASALADAAPEHPSAVSQIPVPMRRSPSLSLSARDRALLDQWSRGRTLAARVVQRSRIVLMLANGNSIRTIVKELGVSATTVRLWRRRFDAHGPDGLLTDAPGRGRKPALTAAAREALKRGHRDGDAMTVRERARELGVSAATVSRWKRRGS